MSVIKHQWSLIAACFNPEGKSYDDLIELTYRDVEVSQLQGKYLHDRYVSDAFKTMFPEAQVVYKADVDTHVLNQLHVTRKDRRINVFILFDEKEREAEMRLLAFERLVNEVYKDMEDVQNHLTQLSRMTDHIQLHYRHRRLTKEDFTCQ